MSLTNQEMKKTNASGSGSGAEAVAAVCNFVVDYFDSMGFDLMVVRFTAYVIGTSKRAFFMYDRVVQRAVRMWSLMQSLKISFVFESKFVGMPLEWMNS
jgi:hypothetical protein